MNNSDMLLNLPSIFRQINFRYDSKDVIKSRERIRFCLLEFYISVDNEATAISEGTRPGEVVLAVTEDGFFFNVYHKHWICGNELLGWHVYSFLNKQMYEIEKGGIRKEIEAEVVIE